MNDRAQAAWREAVRTMPNYLAIEDEAAHEHIRAVFAQHGIGVRVRFRHEYCRLELTLDPPPGSITITATIGQ